MLKRDYIVIVLIICYLVLNVNTINADEISKQVFIKKSIEYPQFEEKYDDNYYLEDLLCARYADDKTPIPLCGYYNGRMYATIPKENAEREIEVFWADEIEFAEDEKYSTENYMFLQLQALCVRGVLSINEDGYIGPDAFITRGQACNIVVKMAGFILNDELISPFEDVTKDYKYYDDIVFLYDLGIVQGVENEKFEPDRFITREELVVMVSKFAEILYNNQRQTRVTKAGDILAEDSNFNRKDFQSLEFKDVASISEWARSAYELMGASVMYDDLYHAYFNPQSYAKKRDLAKILFGILEINVETYKR